MESQAAHRTLQSGDMLSWYRIERILGRGGFGVIYLATDTNLEHQVAIKEYIPSDVATRNGDSQVFPISDEHSDVFRWGMDRFIKEARNLVKFNHPNIVRVMSVFQENNTAYMVMEFEEGEDLRSYLRHPGTNSEHSLKQLILPISKGLAEVHRRGFIHRDIKPANILVRKNGSPVLLDFGSARNASKYSQQSLTALVSVGYAPLEQYNSESDEQQGPWTDIYALGGTLYYAISGQDPIESTRRGAALLNGAADPLIPAHYLGEGKYSPGFLRAIDWALQFGIADRPQSLSDWMQALLAENPDTTPATAFTGTGPTTAIAADRPGVDTKTLRELSDATVLSRERRPRSGQLASLEPAMHGNEQAVGAGLRGIAVIALLLAMVAVGLWFTSENSNTDKINNTNELAINDATTGTAATATSLPPAPSPDAQTRLSHNAEAARQALTQAEDEAQTALPDSEAENQVQTEPEINAAPRAEQDTTTDDTAQTQAIAAKQITEQAALEVAEQAAADAAAREQAQQAAADKERADALAAVELERQKASEAAQKKREAVQLAREAARQSALRKERRLKQAIGSAQSSLRVGDLTAATQQLSNAQSIDSNDTRVQTLAFAIQAAQDEYNKPVSDADFDKVTRMFDGLRRAIEDKDEAALDRLAVSSQQSSIFKSLMKSFDRIDVSITGIRVRNADKSITGSLRIDALVRANGDRGSLSEKYAVRTITSRRVNGDWSKIDW